MNVLGVGGLQTKPAGHMMYDDNWFLCDCMIVSELAWLPVPIQ